MAKNDNLKDFVTDIADAIREKKGTTDLINPQNFSDEIRNLTTESDLIEAPILPPAELVNNGKIYRVHSGAEYFFSSIEDNPDYVLPLDDVIISFNENFGTGITNVEVIVVESVENIENPRATAAPNLYIYADRETYEGFAFIDQDGIGQLVKTSLVEVLDELSGGLFLGVEYIGAVDNKSDITQNGVYYVKEEKTIIGVPNASGEKDISVFDGTEWTPAGASNGLDYDQASGIWYSASYGDGGKVEDIMYYVFPLLQDGNGKRNVKVYSADAEGFYDSTTPGMTYRIDGNQIKLEMESNGEVSDAGSFDYEVIDNKVHLTMDGEIVFTKIVTGLGKNDNGQLVYPTITENGVYNAIALNDPESLFFGAVVDVKGSGGGDSIVSKVFGENHPAIISKVSELISTNNMTSAEVEQTYGWKIGDTCNIALSNGENIQMRIIGINHDDKSDGSGKAGLTLQMVECLATRYHMNSQSTNAGGYVASKMKTQTLPTIKSLLPKEWQDVIKLVNKKSANGGGSNYSETLTLSEDIFLFAEIEIFGTTLYAQDGVNEGSVYEYWNGKAAADRIKKYDTDADGVADTATYWWLRSCNYGLTNQFCTVSTSGSPNTYNSSSPRGVAFGFCV